MDLNTTWFVLIAVLFAGYAILDGFDLGVGVLHLFFPDSHERRLFINSIAPVWDGNEVWLLTGGGALFAAFPMVYATVFSGFYLAFMLLLAALIFRAVSMEFRGKVESPRWRGGWDWAFGLGSLLPAVLFGVAFGNILRGIEVDAGGTYTGSFFDLLNPYALLIGVLTLALFTMHGALYLVLKTEGDLRARITRWAAGGWMVTLSLYLVSTIVTMGVSPVLFDGLARTAMFWILFPLVLAGFLGVPVFLKSARYGWAFLASSVMIAGMLGLSATSLFPRMLPSITDPEFSLTVYNASSSPTTLTVMLIIALIGMPLVIGYTILIYRVFKGKTVITGDSY